MKKALKRRIARMEGKYGSDDPYVQMMKDQLHRVEQGPARSAHDLYITGSMKRPKEAATSNTQAKNSQ